MEKRRRRSRNVCVCVCTVERDHIKNCCSRKALASKLVSRWRRRKLDLFQQRQSMDSRLTTLLKLFDSWVRDKGLRSYSSKNSRHFGVEWTSIQCFKCPSYSFFFFRLLLPSQKSQSYVLLQYSRVTHECSIAENFISKESRKRKEIKNNNNNKREFCFFPNKNR